MKKINLFNKTISPLSDGKGCPVERGGVWCIPFPWERGPAEQPGGMGITPSPLSPTKFLKFCGTRFGATPSWKEGEHKVPSYRRMPVSRGFNRGGGIPLFSGMTAVIFALFVATPSFAEPTELDKKTVASKAYVDTKQDIIETGLVEFYDAPSGETHNVPSLVSYGTGTNNTDGLLGNKIGIMSFDVFSDPLSSYSYNEMDNYVPTVRAVASEFQYIWDSMPSSWSALSWVVNNDNGVNRTNAINAYNTEFGNGTNQWAGNGGDLINGIFLSNSLALKQNKLPEQNDDLIPGQQFRNDSTGKAASVLAPTTAGNVTQVALWDADGRDTASWDLDEYTSNATERTAIRQSIPTVGAVEAGLNQKQNKMTCAGWDSDTHTDEHCWLWSIE